MNKIEAIVIDLDGTLLNNNQTVGKKDYKCLKLLEQKKVIRIIATGRSLYSFNKIIKPDFPIDYLIFSAGAGIMDFNSKKIITSFHIEKNDVKIIAEKLNELKIDFQVRNKVPQGHIYKYKQYSDKNADFERINEIYKEFIEELINFDSFEDASRFLCISDNEKIIDEVYQNFPDFGIVRATSSIDNKTIWMEIFTKNVNKGSSLSYLSKQLNFSLNNTLGIGNDYNDIDFLNLIGLSYMVENASDNLKNLYLKTVSCENNPLSEVLRNYFSC